MKALHRGGVRLELLAWIRHSATLRQLRRQLRALGYTTRAEVIRGCEVPRWCTTTTSRNALHEILLDTVLRGYTGARRQRAVVWERGAPSAELVVMAGSHRVRRAPDHVHESSG